MNTFSAMPIMKKIAVAAAVIALLVFIALYAFLFSAPAFPLSSSGELSIVIESGQSVRSIANELQQNGLVKSSTVAQSFIILFGGERGIKAGMYVFKGPQNVFRVAGRVATGDYGYVPVKLTIPEGTNSRKMTEIVAGKFPHIAAAAFETEAKSHEGYLFPETYFFAPIETQEMILRRMADTFDEEIKQFEDDIRKSGKSLKEIITMASILENEVQTKEDRRLVADLLWRRLAEGMALQVDASLGYALDKASSELTVADLRDESNPYNTYTHRGLPPTPISNPGIESIEAALNPSSNEYVFYLSDKNGITHFAETYAEHLNNKKKYIK